MRLALLSVLLTLLLGFGCISPPSSSISKTFEFDSGSSSATIKQSSLSVQVSEGQLNSKFNALKTTLTDKGAKISNIQYNEYSDRNEYNLQIRVPPSKLDSVVDDIRSTGTVSDVYISSQDISSKYSELDLKIKNKETFLARLRALYNSSENITSLLEVEREIARVEEELEVLTNEKRYVVSEIELSSIYVKMYENRGVLGKLSFTFSNLVSDFSSAFDVSIRVLTFLIGFVVPFALLWFLYKRHKGGGFGKMPLVGPQSRKPDINRIPSA